MTDSARSTDAKRSSAGSILQHGKAAFFIIVCALAAVDVGRMSSTGKESASRLTGSE